MPGLPVNALIATALALLPVPSLGLLDRLDGNCGDGLCSLVPALLILLGLAGATLVFVGRSARRNEAPSVLRLAPFALWTMALLPLLL